MGTLHNPLYLMGPYLLNLKCLYRKVVQLGLDWDQRIPLTLELELFEILQSFLKMEKVLFPRRVAFIESVFYGSNTTMGVSLYIRNHLKNGQIITRLLKNKVKLVPPDANTTPRSELLSALICMRILNTLQGDLKTFFELFKSVVKLRAYGDSQVVLSQLLRDSYYFKVWVAIRVSEIQSLVGAIVPRVEFFHIPGTLNAADILTTLQGSPRRSPLHSQL